MSSLPMIITSAPLSAQNVIRPIANFKPSMWGDSFLNFTPMDKVKQVKEETIVEELKEKVRQQLHDLACKPSEQLHLIDAIQRLGIAYQFDEEINNALNAIYDSYGHEWNHNNDLYATSLCFRLLRQHGFNLSSEIFQKFMDEGGLEFKQSLTGDVAGMLAFYEATHLGVPGEDILDRALSFTTKNLDSLLSKNMICDPLKAQVQHALKQPIRKALTRLEAIFHISLYKQYALCDESLINLSVLDFNLLQSLHRKELSEVSRWWKDLDFARKLPYARERFVECHIIWAMGAFFEPQYSRNRVTVAKIVALLSVINDTYDAYGTYDELELFLEAVERWSATSMETLPDYMKFIFQELLHMFGEIENQLAKEGKSYNIYYVKEAVKVLIRSYFDEAKWCKQNCVPTIEDHMSVSLLSCGYLTISTICFLGMGDIVTEETLKWVLTLPLLVKSACIVCRFMDDIVTHKKEQQRVHVASSVECCMKQYGISQKDADDLLRKRIENAWKDINQETLMPMAVEMSIAQPVVNLARAMDSFYKYESPYTDLGENLKKTITSLVINPII